MNLVRKHSVFAVEDVDDEERKGDQCGQLQRRPYDAPSHDEEVAAGATTAGEVPNTVLQGPAPDVSAMRQANRGPNRRWAGVGAKGIFPQLRWPGAQ